MLDRYNRNISYLRISVTDRCNLRCRYCMPADGIEWMPHDEMLSFEEIVEIVKKAVEKGITKVRLTGGEPLVRKGIVDLVRMIATVQGIEDLAMTTNGILLNEYAQQLADAGLHRVNISLDTTNAERYEHITRGGDIQQVFNGIRAAKEAGLAPIKLNCVVMNSSDEPEAVLVKNFAKEHDLKVRFIHQMDLETGHFSKVEGGDGGDCNSCNRLRLTATGEFKPCLFSNKQYSIRQYGIDEAMKQAIDNKPLAGSRNQSGKFYNIGG